MINPLSRYFAANALVSPSLPLLLVMNEEKEQAAKLQSRLNAMPTGGDGGSRTNSRANSTSSVSPSTDKAGNLPPPGENDSNPPVAVEESVAESK